MVSETDINTAKIAILVEQKKLVQLNADLTALQLQQQIEALPLTPPPTGGDTSGGAQ